MNKSFMDFMDDDFFREKEFDINAFIEELSDISKMRTFDILDKLSLLKDEQIKKVLVVDDIRNVLKVRLLFESVDNQWYYYRKILEKINVIDFISLYTAGDLKQFFSTNKCGHISVFFNALCEKDVNRVVNYILNDDEMFCYFIQNSSFYSYAELSYDLVKKIILKQQSNNLEFNDDFLANLPVEYQRMLIKEPEISDDSLVSILSSFRNSVKSEFFLNDRRSIYLYNRFDIVNLVKNGIKFNDDILKKRDFFDRLKTSSFIEFRNIINDVEKNNNSIVIEDRLDEYYSELIEQYDIESGLFKDYKKVLENPKKYEFANTFIFNFDIVDRISFHLTKGGFDNYYYDDREGLEKFLKNETSKKLSEIINDALLRDNIYNVWINIKEMIRYNNSLVENDKVLDDDKVNFYKMILDFDKVSNNDKIILYNKLKKTNFSMVFYEDLRNVKNTAYDKIKTNLINPNLYPEYIDVDNTNNYGVNVYDFRDKRYTMLVRTQAEFRDVDRYRRGCYSIINNENNQVFGENDFTSFLYGYNSFDNDMVLHMFESDSFSSNLKDEGSRFVNRIMSLDELVKSNSGYNEVQLVNVKSDKGKYKWIAKKPDFLVVFDYIRQRHVEECKRLGIPIVIISKKVLDKNRNVYDIEPEAYVKDWYSEHENRIKR